MKNAILGALLALSLGGCASQPGAFRDDAYHNEHYSFRVRYESPGHVASADWNLENFQVDDGGHPTAIKEGPEYRYKFQADLDGDGRLESGGELDLVDLRLVHRTSAAKLWLSSIPLSQTLAETDLGVLAKEFVHAVSGTGLDVTRLGDVKQQTFTTRIVEEKATRVDDVPAHRVVFEMASVEQLKLDPNSRWQRVAVVLVRPGFFWAQQDVTQPKQLFPVLMVAGYESQPDRFDAGVADFDAFLGRISFAPVGLGNDTARVLACAPAKDPIRVVVLRKNDLGLVSPDLDDAQNKCVKEVFDPHFWDWSGTFKSFVFRKRDVAH